ncbi:MAG: hypothetical protein ACXVNO_01525 [Bacteroidia bacterium]
MDLKKVILVLIVLTTFICGCKKKVDTEITGPEVTSADYLSSAVFQKLNIEIVYDKGAPPASETVNNLKAFLINKVNKPGGINITLKEINGPAKQRMSLVDIIAVEKSNRSPITLGNTVNMYIYLSNSEYEEAARDYKTLGIQYGTGAIVLFGRSMHNSGGGIGQPAYYIIESSVAEHEISHALGLANTGTKMVNDHGDNNLSHHCNNKNCLMYFAVETSDIADNLLGGLVPPLDANCRQDLKASGGK